MQEVITMINELFIEFDVIKAYILALEKSNADKLKEQWMDNQDVMQALHISKRTLQTLRDNGTLPYSQIGFKVFYKVTDVAAMLENSYSLSKTLAHGN
jgi:hypothetical protein